VRSVKLLEYALTLEPDTVLDLAVGTGMHAIAFLGNGLDVTGVDLTPAKIRHPQYKHYQAPYEELELDEQFDMVWSSHTLEHIPNAQHFLMHLRKWTKDGGYLAISVPPARQDRLHIGHLSLWTPAHLVYNLIKAGWDCTEALWYTEYCTIGLIVQKTKEVNFTGETGMPNEALWLNQYTPLTVGHEDAAWWPNRWHEDLEPRVPDPPHVTIGQLETTLPPLVKLSYGPNPKLREKYERNEWRK